MRDYICNHQDQCGGTDNLWNCKRRFFHNFDKLSVAPFWPGVKLEICPSVRIVYDSWADSFNKIFQSVKTNSNRVSIRSGDTSSLTRRQRSSTTSKKTLATDKMPRRRTYILPRAVATSATAFATTSWAMVREFYPNARFT